MTTKPNSNEKADRERALRLVRSIIFDEGRKEPVTLDKSVQRERHTLSRLWGTGVKVRSNNGRSWTPAALAGRILNLNLELLIETSPEQIYYTAEDVTPLIAEARDGDPLSIEAARRLLSLLQKQGTEAPLALLKFGADWAANPRKGGPGLPADINLERNYRIVESISVLRDYGYVPLRNTATNHRESGCDLVSEILGLGYESVASVWKKFHTMM